MVNGEKALASVRAVHPAFYNVVAFVKWPLKASGARTVSLVRNSDSSIIANDGQVAVVDQPTSHHVSITMHLAGGDSIDLYVEQETETPSVVASCSLTLEFVSW